MLDFHKPKDLPDREVLLHKIFNIYRADGVVEENEFHLFCKFAKGKEGEELLEMLDDVDRLNQELLEVEKEYA